MPVKVATVPETPAAATNVPPAAPSAVDTATSPETPPAEPLSKERILLAAPQGPLIIEFHLSIDGRPHTEALDKLVAEVLPLADTDGDGRPTWKEITSSKRFKYGQYGNLPLAGENDVKQVIERYDIDRDGLVDASELPRFLTRNAGGSRAFSVRGSADFRLSGRRGSPLWKVLDTDDDGALSAAEMAAAPGRMLSRDLDDDEILAASDLAPPATLDSGMMTDRRRRGPEIVRLLGPHANWDSVRLLLEEQYGSPLTPESFPLTPGLFGQLDANHDGRLQKAEFAGLNEVAPQVVVAVGFGREGEAPAEPSAAEPSAADQPPPVPRLRLVSISAELAAPGPSPPTPLPQGERGEQRSLASAVEQAGRLTLDVAGTSITLYLSDTLAAGNYAMQAQQLLSRARRR